MSFRFHFAELVSKHGQDSEGKYVTTEEWKEKAMLETSSKTVLAATLRGLADELDPPQKAMR